MEQISCRELGKTHYVFFLTGSIMSFFKLLVLFSTLKNFKKCLREQEKHQSKYLLVPKTKQNQKKNLQKFDFTQCVAEIPRLIFS